jgi:hypothetical protein
MFDELADQEFHALKQIGDAQPMIVLIPLIRERLISMGYAREDQMLGLIITDEGMLRIMTGK